jgi:phosphoribosyl-ATP pyrophosphohydrolase/phosphoribosyl-AMP cyclohydrolase
MKNLVSKIDWGKGQGLVPAIIQDADSGAVLMLGYMNRESFGKTLATKKVWFYSRSKQRLWMKGETSGNVLKIVDIKSDCDNDSLLVKVRPAGPTCHRGIYSCFRESKKTNELSALFQIIQDRKAKMPRGSYTASLFRGGLDKISLKVAEEALEVVQAAQKQTKQRLAEEAVDLIYHLFVLLVGKGIGLQQIFQEIKRRRAGRRKIK